jgi:hypothetical protein
MRAIRLRVLPALFALTLFSCGDDDRPTRSIGSDDQSGDRSGPANVIQLPESSLLLFKDRETGSVWNLRGEALTGELEGAQLQQLPAYSAYWFAWSSFWPGTSVWNAIEGDGEFGEEAFAAISTREYGGDVPKDGIPPLDDPPQELGAAQFVKAEDAVHVQDDHLVVGMHINGDARAYPVRILNYHEIVNHTVGGTKVSVTYCPLTASGINIAGDGIVFGNTGGLYNNNMVMYDRETESFWGQMRLGSILGPRAGERLRHLPVYQGRWKAWRELYPETLVLSTNTGYVRNYTGDYYIESGYTASDGYWFWQAATYDTRFHPKEMTLGILGERRSRAYVLSHLQENPVVNDRFEGTDLVVVYDEEAKAALAFERKLDGRVLSFEA